MGISRKPVIRVKEVDGSPDSRTIDTIELPNGTLTVTGQKATAAVATPADVAAVAGDVIAVGGALSAHLADATDSHDASAISFAPAGSIAATNVQAAIEEVAAEATGGGTITIEEQDGTPSVASVNTIKVTNGTLTDEGGGVVSIATGGGGGSVSDDIDAAASLYMFEHFR